MMLGRSLIGGGLAALLLVAPGAPSLAQTAATAAGHAASSGGKLQAKQPHRTAKAAKPATAKAAATMRDPAKKVAGAKKKPETKPETKKVAAAKKPEQKKLAAEQHGQPKKVAAAPKPLPAEYTITTTRNHVTYTETRSVPVPAPPADRVAAAPVTAAVAPAPAAGQPQAAPAAGATAVKLAAAPATGTAATSAPASRATSAAAASTTPAKHDAPAAAAAAKPADTSAATFVAAFLRDAFQIARSAGTTSLQRRAQLADLFSGKMDIGRIAGYTTSDELTAATPDFQQRFRTILISYLVETYYPRLELASGPSIKVETVAAPALADGTAVVWTTFSKEGWGSQSVQWRLAAASGGYKVVDIMTAGASLVQMERDTFHSVMRDGGLPELMAKLDARTKSLAMAATE